MKDDGDAPCFNQCNWSIYGCPFMEDDTGDKPCPRAKPSLVEEGGNGKSEEKE